MVPAYIHAESLTYAVAGRTILDRVDLTVAPGEDLELTDWDALGAAVDAFAAGLAA